VTDRGRATAVATEFKSEKTPDWSAFLADRAPEKHLAGALARD
jgi:hypothetical protein